MAQKKESWKVKDKRRLLLELMDELSGSARISFEGRLGGLRVLRNPDASDQPTQVLKRNTVWPVQDFIIVPLEPGAGRKIMADLGGTIPKSILHIQIEKGGVLQFGAYDGFDPGCIYFGSAVSDSFIESLTTEGIIRPFTEAKPRRTRENHIV